jgi:hypothetical protein
MIISTILFPITDNTTIEAYAASFSSWQMLPFIPSFILSPIFVVFMLSVYNYISQDKKIFGQLGVGFALICAAILSMHYYIQLTVVNQGLLNNQTAGLWLFATPNPNSFFWTFAALGYGFMGFALLSIVPVFTKKSQRNIKLLLVLNGIVGVCFLVGNAMSIFLINIFVSFIWGVLFPIAMILTAKMFKETSRIQ